MRASPFFFSPPVPTRRHGDCVCVCVCVCVFRTRPPPPCVCVRACHPPPCVIEKRERAKKKKRGRLVFSSRPPQKHTFFSFQGACSVCPSFLSRVRTALGRKATLAVRPPHLGRGAASVAPSARPCSGPERNKSRRPIGPPLGGGAAQRVRLVMLIIDVARPAQTTASQPGCRSRLELEGDAAAACRRAAPRGGGGAVGPPPARQEEGRRSPCGGWWAGAPVGPTAPAAPPANREHSLCRAGEPGWAGRRPPAQAAMGRLQPIWPPLAGPPPAAAPSLWRRRSRPGPWPARRTGQAAWSGVPTGAAAHVPVVGAGRAWAGTTRSVSGHPPLLSPLSPLRPRPHRPSAPISLPSHNPQRDHSLAHLASRHGPPQQPGASFFGARA